MLCGCGQKEVIEGRSYCSRCRHRKYASSINKRNRERYRDDPNFRERSKNRHKTHDEKSRDGTASVRQFLGRLFNRLGRGRKTKHIISISVDDLIGLWESQSGKCAITSLPMLLKRKSPLTVSIDRIRSGDGYVNGNIQLVCMSVNLGKNVFTQEQMVDFIASVRSLDHNNAITRRLREESR